MRSSVEDLECRILLSVSINSAGWTQVIPSSDSRLIYVSSSAGSDSNSGLSTTSPVKTIAKGESLLRNGMPDELLLKAGDTFNDNFGVWQWSGRSAQEPMLIGSYGTGARPIIDAGTDNGLNAISSVSNVDIMGLAFYANGRDPSLANPASTVNSTGIRWVATGSNLLIENCLFDYFGTNVIIQATTGASINNVVFRQNQVLNAYMANNVHSQGLFAFGVNGLDIEDCEFDHNGWNETVPGAVATIFNHNVYIQSNCTGFIFNNNTDSRASSFGIEARAGGQVTNNLFITDPLALEIGGGTDAVPIGGVSATVSGNVIIGSNTINGSSRGYGIQVYNDLDPNTTNLVTNNIMIGDNYSIGTAIQIINNTGFPDPTDAQGINNLAITNNVVLDWGNGLSIDPALSMGSTGYEAINSLVVKNNQFVAPTVGTFVSHGPAYLASAETWQDNDFVSPTNPNRAFNLAGTYLTAASWQQTVELTATSQMPVYPDSSRTIASYNAYLGGTNNLQAFMAAADSLSSANWNTNYTAAGPINYIQEGFGMANAAGVTLGTSGTSTQRSLSHQTFALTRAPLSDVQVTLKLTQLVTGKTTSFMLTFTPTNWDVAQTIPSSAILGWADGVAYSVSGTVRSQDQAFNGGITPSSLTSVQGFSLVPTSITPPVVSIPAAAGVVVNPVQESPAVVDTTAGIVLGTSGTSAQRSLSDQTVALTQAPVANVQATLKLTQLVTGKTTSFTLTFTPTNWNVAQKIPFNVILGWADGVAYSVSGTVRSQDQAFNGHIIASTMSSVLGFSLASISMPPTPVISPTPTVLLKML